MSISRPCPGFLDDDDPLKRVKCERPRGHTGAHYGRPVLATAKFLESPVQWLDEVEE